MHLTWTEYHLLWTLLAEAVVASAWGVTVGIMVMAGVTPKAVRHSPSGAVRAGVFALIMLVHMSGLVLAAYAVKHPLRGMACAAAAMTSVLVSFVLWAVLARQPGRRREARR